MPVYTFRCTACGVERDIERKIDNRDDPALCQDTFCLMKRKGVQHDFDPACYAARMVRVPTAASFEIKGYSAKNGYSK